MNSTPSRSICFASPSSIRAVRSRNEDTCRWIPGWAWIVQHRSRQLSRIHSKLDVRVCNVLAEKHLPERRDKVINPLFRFLLGFDAYAPISPGSCGLSGYSFLLRSSVATRRSLLVEACSIRLNLLMRVIRAECNELAGSRSILVYTLLPFLRIDAMLGRPNSKLLYVGLDCGEEVPPRLDAGVLVCLDSFGGVLGLESPDSDLFLRQQFDVNNAPRSTCRTPERRCSAVAPMLADAHLCGMFHCCQYPLASVYESPEIHVSSPFCAPCCCCTNRPSASQRAFAVQAADWSVSWNVIAQVSRQRIPLCKVGGIGMLVPIHAASSLNQPTTT
ncbi:hypothetical protein KC345_g146 [Hortaea werneckii]|nr:hypothetical protein KC345_g146 [Hortaea werneckii]